MSNRHCMDLHEVDALQEIAVRGGLFLRPLAASDSEQLLAILDRDPDIRERVTVAKRLHDQHDIEREVEAIADDDGLIRYVIVENGVVIGLISLWRDDGFFGQAPEPDGYGFGYFLDPLARGRGVITTSLQVLMNTLQAALPVRVFMAFCEDDNQESSIVLMKLGFERTDEVYGEPNTGWQERKYRRETSRA